MKPFFSGAGATFLPALAFLSLGACVAAAPARSPSPATVILEKSKPAAEQPYSGAESCGECHRRVYLFWRGTAHAASLAGLDVSGERRNPSCLRCHSTGFGERTGYVDDAATPELASVGCESCHGAGGDHAGSAFPGLVPVSGPVGCRSCDVSRMCRSCHTTTRSPDFDLRSALAAVSCAAAGEGRSGEGDGPAEK